MLSLLLWLRIKKQKGTKKYCIQVFWDMSMKWHVEFEHVELLVAYVVEIFAIESIGVHNQW